MRVRRRWVWLAAVPVAALAGGMLALAACGSGPDTRFAAEAARTADVVERVSAPGSVRAAAQSDLHAPAAAKLAELRVRDGQRVRRGEVVAQLSSTQVDSSIRQARAALDSASALGGLVPNVPVASALAAIQQVQQQLSSTSEALLRALRSTLATLPRPQRDQLKTRLDRAEQQVATSQRRATQAAELAVAAVDQQTDALRSALNSATAAQRSQAQLALDLAMDQKAALTLRAPIAGTVQLGRASTGNAGATGLPDLSQLPESAQQAVQGLAGGGGQSAGGPPLRPGDQLAAGQTVATVYDVSDLQVASEVDETDIALVKVGQPAEVQLDAFPGASFPARVRRIAVAPSSNQSAAGGVTYEVDLVLASSSGGPTPRVGMTATADIQVRQARDTLSVPGSALIGRDRGQQAVFVIEGGRVHLRGVRVSVDGEDRAAIAAGLRQGERVVSRGAERLHDGERWPGS
jgi:multidrug efflux pump subunit AcrA (membrane-fusion protein)